ncbi:tripartite tricarboxylate transporter substrate binding protein [Bordetella sp. BOR01]|uniref:Bug family tripartite tricarboxylate transporter substrate binding protein n=1 Tax=Bordetella sp. BOR01 TaxID=2854779 RepID=UPI001C44CF47|nr:tripartite tricarboxylate transporter substrate binding protein [Bordetella sp. BOR01]MBV7482360.1 tripartite tricarboxylate transporter substrate binding protein [Bordetella sp. BOR01]
MSLKGLGAALLLAAGFCQAEESYPSRPITAVVCCAGTVETVARFVTEAAGAELGQPIVVMTKPGASGMIAADYVSKAKPDGYTIFIGTNSSHGANQSLFKRVPYDYVKDFTPISGVADGKLVLVVNPALPIKNVADLTADARTTPGKLSYGWASSSTRLAMEKYKMMEKIDIRDVPYKTNPQAAIDISGGTIDVMFAEFSSALPLIKAGRLRALAVSSTHRDKALPDVPTMAEAGVPGYRLTWWMGVWAPAGLPKGKVEKLSAAIAKALAKPELQKSFAVAGVEPLPFSPSRLSAFQVEEHDSWRDIIRAAGIEPQ